MGLAEVGCLLKSIKCWGWFRERASKITDTTELVGVHTTMFLLDVFNGDYFQPLTRLKAWYIITPLGPNIDKLVDFGDHLAST